MVLTTNRIGRGKAVSAIFLAVSVTWVGPMVPGSVIPGASDEGQADTKAFASGLTVCRMAELPEEDEEDLAALGFRPAIQGIVSHRP